jgi:hypothetical protein
MTIDAPTKTFWIAWTNTDTTEGRGWAYPLVISESRATAIRLGKKRGVMGGDCSVTPFESVKLDGRWLFPALLSEPNTVDLLEDWKYAQREDAIKKVRAAGIDEETIKSLINEP